MAFTPRLQVRTLKSVEQSRCCLNIEFMLQKITLTTCGGTTALFRAYQLLATKLWSKMLSFIVLILLTTFPKNYLIIKYCC